MISIIIPIYNAEERLPIMLECLKSQSESNYELLLVNDGSTDGSRRICDQASKYDQRIRVFHQENRGVSAARNKGMQEIKGEYFLFLDADDEIGPEYLEVLLSKCKKQDCDIAVCDVAVVKDNNETRRFTHNDAVLDSYMALNLLLTREKISSGPYGKIFKKIFSHIVKFPMLKVYEDILFVKDAFNYAEKIVVTDKTEYRYIHNDLGTMKHFSEAPSIDIVVATEELLNFINEQGKMSPKCIYITMSHLMQYVRGAQNNSDVQSKKFIYEAKLLFRHHIRDILECKTFSWKEKVQFIAFAYGIMI